MASQYQSLATDAVEVLEVLLLYNAVLEAL